MLNDILPQGVHVNFPRNIRFQLDPHRKTMTVVDEDSDSIYKVMFPIKQMENESPVECQVTAGKLAQIKHLLSSVQGDLFLTCRSTTLTFQSGKKQFHIPNQLSRPSISPLEESFYGNRAVNPEQFSQLQQDSRFQIPDKEILLRVVANARGAAIRMRILQGTAEIDSLTFPAKSWHTTELLLPGETLYQRLQQLPAAVELDAAVNEHRICFMGKKGDLHREVWIRPYPRTTLYISMPRQRKNQNRENSCLRVESDNDNQRKVEDEKGVNIEQEAISHLPLPTTIAPEEEQADRDDSTGEDTASTLQQSFSLEQSSFEQLQQLPGLNRVKKQIWEIAQFASFEKKRMEALRVPMSLPTLHMAFLGNPGTGKTMVARMIGNIFKELGFLKSGHVVEVDRLSLVGAYMGHTEANLKKYVNRALGGILFIDEAYALYKKDSNKDFGLHAIYGLLKIMEDYRDQMVVILSGYTREMNEMIDSNPGLRERIPFLIHFPDYTEEELIQIAEFLAEKDHYVLTEEVKDFFMKQVMRKKVDETFGNARTVRNIIEKAKIRHGVHAADKELLEGQYSIFKREDFIDEDQPEEANLPRALTELDQLVGLEQIKQLVKQMIDVLKLEQKRLQHGLKEEPITLHMSFTGNPGTGKTTVARLMGKILWVMGLLPRGHFVETSRKDLVSGFVGQTAIKTEEKIKEALGGVLFIDEAYALAGNGKGDFGKEAIATLIKEMEDKKGRLTVILAGYTAEMEKLFQTNPGLKSRVRFSVHFPDYTASELVAIVKQKAEASDYRLSEEAEEKLWGYFLQECFAAESDFGNGRLAEKIFEQAKLRMSERISRMEEEPDSSLLSLILPEDLIIDEE